MQTKITSSVTLYGYKQVDENLSMEMESVEDREIETKQQALIPDLVSNLTLTVEGQISAMSVGQSHVLFLTNQRVVTIGSNQFGQRGTQTYNALTATALNLENVVAVSCGLYHSVCLDSRNKVHSWGRGAEGQLGLGEVEFQYEPSQVQLGVGIKSICCGGSHTLMLSEDGQVYACGDDSWGQLGLGGGHVARLKPTRIEWFVTQKIKIIHIECGLEHSLFLSSDNEVYSCGNNLFNQCGLEGISNVNKPTLIGIPMEANETITKIYASMGTFSACMTSHHNIFVWGTGSWGHARKPTNIINICQFQGVPRFHNLIMGDNYALLWDSKNYLVFGTHKLPDLGSQKPLEKLVCQVLTATTGLKLQLGYKMMVVVDKELQCVVPSRRYSIPLEDLKSSEKKVNTQKESREDKVSEQREQKQANDQKLNSQYSKFGHIRNQSNEPHESVVISPNQAQQITTLQKTLNSQTQEILSLKREVEFCKSQMKQKDYLIVELQSSVEAHQNMQKIDQHQSGQKIEPYTQKPKPEADSPSEPYRFRQSSFSQVLESILALPSYKPDVQRDKIEKRPYQQCEPQYTPEAKKQQTLYEKQDLSKVSNSDTRKYDNHSNQAEIRRQSQQGNVKHDQIKNQEARRLSLYSHEKHEPLKVSNFDTRKHYLKEPIKVTNQKKVGIQRQSSVVASSFEYKTYEKLRLISNDESSETRMKKIDESQFSLSRYNMKSIRSITPYEGRNISTYDRQNDMLYNTQNSELKKSIAVPGNDVQAFSIQQNNNHFVDFERNRTPESSGKRVTTDFVPTRAYTNSNINDNTYFKDIQTPVSGYDTHHKSPHINTSIIDKICNYQRVMGLSNKPKIQNDDTQYIDKQRSNYTDQYNSVAYTPCDTPNQYDNLGQFLNKQYEDFYKLRG